MSSAVQQAKPIPPPEVFNVASYLRNADQSSLRIREGALNGKRVRFFKGKSAVTAIMNENYKSPSRPNVTTREEAGAVITQLLLHQFIIRCDKQPSAILKINPAQQFNDEFYYAWLYEGSQLRSVLGGIGLLIAVLTLVLFPLWPPVLRNGAWYVSVAGLGFLGFLFVLAIIRLILFVITFIVLPPGVWLFPNLFEDVGFVESFIPLWAWHVPTPDNKVSNERRNQ